MSDSRISHAFVLPDEDFRAWYDALRPYLDTFERVAVVRGTGGNDLNPYRNVSAVTAPRLWLNGDPLYHIRRIYPRVVRVDVVQATTPQELAHQLQARIARRDRFGESLNEGRHLHERFVLAWPTDYPRMRIVRPFAPSANAPTERLGIGIASEAGAKVMAGAAGWVIRRWTRSRDDALRLGQYVQVRSVVGGQPSIVTYANLRSAAVQQNDEIAQGAVLGEAAGETFTVLVQQPGGEMGYTIPSIVDPTPLIYVDNLRVYPTAEGLRVRALPMLSAEIIGLVNPWDALRSKEQHGRTLRKVGREGEWLRVRTPSGGDGFVAAWFLEAKEYRRYFDDVNPLGVNLDAFHPLGTPEASRLGDLGWVRLNYNVSAGVGSQDIHAAFRRYAPLAERYVQAGYRVLFVITHQTYGEAQPDFLPSWEAMNEVKWSLLIQRLSAMMRRIARQWAGRGLVHAWQVWNEQDAQLGVSTSVPMAAQTYREMLRQVVPAIRSEDPHPYIITGGHISGATAGPKYAQTAISGLSSSARPDGVAFHPYGLGTNLESSFAPFGHIDEAMEPYLAVLPNSPVWITEWGVLDRPNEAPHVIANYATNFISYLKARYGENLAALIWFAWAQGMHNGYGIVDSSGQPRPPLTARFLQA